MNTAPSPRIAGAPTIPAATPTAKRKLMATSRRPFWKGLAGTAKEVRGGTCAAGRRGAPCADLD